tara:strand:+ start:619 stop:876 length:258 start_codon:yes stop_codon:yes gene_type:complete
MLNSQNNKPFGAFMASEFKIGALVSWSEWKIVDNMIDEDVFYGTVVEKITKINGGRSVSVIKVACSDTGEIISLNPFQLRLQETN